MPPRSGSNNGRRIRNSTAYDNISALVKGGLYAHSSKVTLPEDWLERPILQLLSRADIDKITGAVSTCSLDLLQDSITLDPSNVERQPLVFHHLHDNIIKVLSGDHASICRKLDTFP